MKLSPRCLAIVWMFALTLVTTSVAAQDLSPEEIEQYKKLVGEGASLYSSGDYQASIDRLKEARAIYDHPDLTYNIGRALAKLGHCSDARARFESYLDREGLGEDAVRAGEEQLSALEECTETGTVEFACTSPAATVAVSGQTVDCPGSVELEVGEYSAHVTAPGYDSVKQPFTVGLNETRSVDVRMTKQVPVEPSPPSGNDGLRYAGYAALGVGGLALVSGFVVDAGTGARRERIREAEGNPTEIESLTAAGRRATTAAIVLYSVGLVGVGTGVTLLLLRSGESDAEAALGLSASGISATLRW